MYNPYDNQQNGPPSFPSMPSYNPDAAPFRAPSPCGNPGLQHPSHPSYDGRPVEVGFDLAPSGYPSQLTPSYTPGYGAPPQPRPPFPHSHSPQHSHSGPSPQPSRGGHSPRPSYSGLPAQPPYAELQASYSGPILQPPYANHSPHSSHRGVASQYQYSGQPLPSHQPGHSPLPSYVGRNPQSSYSSAYGHQTPLDSHGNTPAQAPARAVQFVFQQPKGWDRAGKVVDDKGRVAYILKNVEKKSWTDSFRDGPNNVRIDSTLRCGGLWLK
ncbi:hypothetical protein C8Q75DRAFT_199015 [Abortiporus biennis]|nr:hypothetical protein C8Q75DRAFT_199015 [Abortiporus biennis]